MDTTLKAWPEALLPHMPTVNELLREGMKFDIEHVEWDDDEMKNLALECSSKLYLELEGDRDNATSEWNHRADNLAGFLTEYADPELMIFGIKCMLTTYQLPIHPFQMPSFSDFQRKAGQLVIDCVEGKKDEHGKRLMDYIAEDIQYMMYMNDNCVEFVDVEAEAKTTAKVDREQQIADRAARNGSILRQFSRVRTDSVAARQARGDLPMPGRVDDPYAGRHVMS